MEGNVGYMTDTEPGSLVAMIDLIKKSEPGYGHYWHFLTQNLKCVKNV